MSANVEFDVVVHVGGGGRSFTAKAKGISQDGVFLFLPAGTQLPHEGRRVQLILDPHDGERPLVIAGKIGVKDASGGLGVSFTSVSTPSRARITALLAVRVPKKAG